MRKPHKFKGHSGGLGYGIIYDWRGVSAIGIGAPTTATTAMLVAREWRCAAMAMGMMMLEVMCHYPTFRDVIMRPSEGRTDDQGRR